jgi:hypothetical protein
MRIVKLYEDYYSNQRFKKELIDFCEMYLAYLIDEGFEVKIIREELTDLVLDIEKVSSFTRYTEGPHGTRTIDSSFKWSEVADHFATFYHMLSKEYKLIKIGNIGGCVNLRQEMTIGERTGWTWKNYDYDTINTGFYGNLVNLDPETKVDKIQIKLEIE